MDLRRIGWIYTGLQTRLRLISPCVTNPRPPPSFRRDISVYLSFSSSRPLLSSPLTWGLRSSSPPIPAKISGLGRVVDWKSAIPVRGDRLRPRLSMLICFRISLGISISTIDSKFRGESVCPLPLLWPFGTVSSKWFLKFNLLRTILIYRNRSRGYFRDTSNFDISGQRLEIIVYKMVYNSFSLVWKCF